MERATYSDLATLEATALRLLAQGGVTRPPVPLNLLALLDDETPIVYRKRNLGKARGVIQRTDGYWMLLVNSALPPPAQRFSTMHEAFHLLYRTGQLTLQHPAFIEYLEWCADRFAAMILMPGLWVQEATLNVPSLGQLAWRFGVSKTAMERRLNELGLALSANVVGFRQPLSGRARAGRE